MPDYQLTFRGLTIGAGTPWQIERLEGVEDLPQLRTTDLDISGRHGQAPGNDLLSGRAVMVSLLVFPGPTATFAQNVEALKAITVPQPAESDLVVELPGRLPRVLRCRPRRRSLPVDVEYSFQYGRAAVELWATDPRIYAQAASSSVIGLPSAATGLTFDAPAPFVFGSAGFGNAAAITNAGNFPAPWIASIAGPVTNPVITLADTGESVLLVGTVNAGETLVVDSAAPAVLLGGTASRYAWVGPGSTWWTLPPGPSTVQFGATAGTGTCTFTTRSTWI